MSEIVKSLDRLLQEFVESTKAKTGRLPRQEFDCDWPSECLQGGPDIDGFVEWRPIRREEKADFSGLEHALELEIHSDIKDYYGSFWSDGIEAEADEGRLSLIQLWNPDDFDRLIENFIGHALAKRRVKEGLTLFVACADDPEYFMSVENTSGKVLLERPGESPIREIAPDLASFLNRLKPVVREAP